MKLLLALAAVLTLTACVVPIPVQVARSTVTNNAPAPAATEFTRQLNAFRVSQGNGQMRPNAALTRAAQAHAEDMLARNYFSHRAQNGPNGVTFGQRARAAGCAMQAGAENIAWGQKSEAEVLQGWQNSPGHRRNLLRPNYTLYGLGRAGNVWVMKLASAC